MNHLKEVLTTNGYVSIPLKLMPTGHLLLKAKINNHPINLILDSGAGGTVIDSGLAEELFLEVSDHDEKAISASSDDVDMQISAHNVLSLSRLKIKDFTVTVMNLNHIRQAFESQDMYDVYGVLGADILIAYHGVIDYEHMRLYLRK